MERVDREHGGGDLCRGQVHIGAGHSVPSGLRVLVNPERANFLPSGCRASPASLLSHCRHQADAPPAEAAEIYPLLQVGSLSSGRSAPTSTSVECFTPSLKMNPKCVRPMICRFSNCHCRHYRIILGHPGLTNPYSRDFRCGCMAKPTNRGIKTEACPLPGWRWQQRNQQCLRAPKTGSGMRDNTTHTIRRDPYEHCILWAKHRAHLAIGSFCAMRTSEVFGLTPGAHISATRCWSKAQHGKVSSSRTAPRPTPVAH